MYKQMNLKAVFLCVFLQTYLVLNLGVLLYLATHNLQDCCFRISYYTAFRF